MADEARQSDGASPPPSKRKKISTSARGVANLTPDQLARKRANDREAQRAIRERTRNQIDTLNARIHELESAQPYLDLQSALRQRDAALAENENIRRRLSTIIGLLEPLVNGNSGLNELAAAAERLPTQDQADGAAYATSLLAASQEAQADGSPAQPPTNERGWHGGSIAGPGIRSWAGPGGNWEPARDNLDPNLQYNQSDERLGVEFLLDNTQRAALQNGVAAAQSHSPLSAEDQDRPGSADQGLDGANMLPKFLPSTCPLDTILLEFLSERKRLIQSGLSPEALAGPRYPDFDPIVDPDSKHASHEVSKVFNDILRTFPDISNRPEQVAVVYVMTLVMRWLVHPSSENYSSLPEWIRPTQSQLVTAYPTWVTYIPWPQLRERIVSSHSAPPFDQFFVPYTTTLSVNWPYAQQDCLIQNPASSLPQSAALSSAQSTPEATKSSPRWIINPVFETHIRDLGNWSLGLPFAETFPDLADTVKVKRVRG